MLAQHALPEKGGSETVAVGAGPEAIAVADLLAREVRARTAYHIHEIYRPALHRCLRLRLDVERTDHPLHAHLRVAEDVQHPSVPRRRSAVIFHILHSCVNCAEQHLLPWLMYSPFCFNIRFTIFVSASVLGFSWEKKKFPSRWWFSIEDPMEVKQLTDNYFFSFFSPHKTFCGGTWSLDRSRYK